MVKRLSVLRQGLVASVVLVSVLWALPEAGASDFAIKSGERPFTIGAAVLTRDKPYQDYDDDTYAAPILLYEGKHLFARGSNLGWKFVETRRWEIAAVGEIMPDYLDAGESDFFNGLDDRDRSFGVGGHAVWMPNNLGLKFVAVRDVTGNSDGTEVRGEVLYRYIGTHWRWVPRIGVVWQNDDYMDYYYGVDRDEAIPGVRPRYSPNDEIGYRFQAIGTYQRKESPWMFLVGLRRDWYGDRVNDSPLTESDDMLTLVGGIAYTFRR